MLYEVLPKAAVYSAALFAVGLAVARALLRRAATDTRSQGLIDPLESRLRRYALSVAASAIAALTARAWAHTAAVFGPAEASRWENLRLIALESRWGTAWSWQVLAAAGLLAAAVSLYRWSRRGWIVYALGAVAFCFTIPLLGHAAGSRWRMLLHVGHLLAGGVWLGTLAAIALLSRLNTGQRRPVENDLVPAIVRRFSSVALPGAATVAATGVVLAALYVAEVLNLITTSYGQALLLKLVGVAGVVSCGRINWRRARVGDVPSARLILTELGFAASIVAATSMLTELEQP
jgi:putative copper resistance protein D